jgi:glycosyltransferase involved in cell wall biosynthesis
MPELQPSHSACPVSTGASPLPRRLVIVPAFNERASVRKVVMRLRRSLPDYDVLVIDDGSIDDTVRQVPPETAVVTLPFNLGIGGAMQTGYRYAALHGYDVAVQVDADGQHRPGQVRRLVEALEGGKADLVVGSRFLIPNKRYRQSPPRKAGAWFLRALIRVMTGLAITDCTSGFRAANRRVIRAFAHWYPEDYPEPEVILLLHRAGYGIGEIPVRMRQRHTGRSSINVLEGVFYVLKVTVCLLLDLVRKPWPQGRVAEAPTSVSRATAPPHEHEHDSLQPLQPVARDVGPAGHDPSQPVAQPVPGGLRWDPPGAGRPTAPHL